MESLDDSDSDWFEKDLPEVSSSTSQNENIWPGEVVDPSTLMVTHTEFDLAHNNSLSVKRKPKKPTHVQSFRKPCNDDFIQPISYTKLCKILKLKPCELFVKLMLPDSGFITAILDETTPHEMVALILEAISIVCGLPLWENKRKLLRILLDSKHIWDKLIIIIITAECPNPIFSQNLGIVLDALTKLFTQCQHFTYFLTILLKNSNKVSTIDCPVEIYYSRWCQPDVCEDYTMFPNLAYLKSSIDVNLADTENKTTVDEYVRAHLSFIRGDFFRPIQNFVQQIMCNSVLPKNTRNVYSYENVKIRNMRMCSLVYIDLTNYGGDLNGISEKHFVPGSLLLLTSSTQFNDLILATVVSRSDDFETNGLISIHINRMENIVDLYYNKYILLASYTFFYTNYHVFSTLQNLNEVTFPMARYILKIENIQEKSILPSISVEKIILNKRQLEGLHDALNHKFTIIHGPPGTGKTHLATTICTQLINCTQRQILVISQSNDALDEILVRLSKSTTQIVRCGNHSKNKKLNKFLFKNILPTTNCHNIEQNLLYATERANFEQESNEFIKMLPSEASKKCIELHSHSKRLMEISHLRKVAVLQEKRVIGMTTSYAAMTSTLLQLLQPEIIIVEEGGQILESFLVAALNSRVQHLVMIGDHKQLPPATSDPFWAKMTGLNISLMERLVKNNFDCVVLNEQRRMAPCIADLVRPHIYPELIDAENVLAYTCIAGMKKQMFFVNCNAQEDKSVAMDFSNTVEATFISRLAQFLVQNDCNTKDVTVLTPYNNQKRLIVKMLSELVPPLEIEVSTLDGFQGKENRVVLMSLVCSNQIGFLRSDERLAVAFSRAKEGFYVIGNKTLFNKGNSLWSKVFKVFDQHNCIGNEIPIVYRNETILIGCNDEFPH